MAKELTWDSAIELVLSEASSPLHYAEIAERISAKSLRKVGATPAATVASTLSRSINAGESPFLRLGDGLYALSAKIAEQTSTTGGSQGLPAEEPETGALRAFGMFWRRSEVVWSGKPRLLGRQGLGASDVNFAEQVGVYLLHDRDRVIYVGRASDTLYARLKAHTTDRLSGRWDRFSWFGLRSATAEGLLAAPTAVWNHEVVIDTLEALLIESLEPPLNRKRGDNFSGVEYLQSVDPEVERSRKKQVLAELVSGAGFDG